MSFTYFDLESTGPDVETDRIIQVGIHTDGQDYETLVNPGMVVPQHVVALTGISNDMLVGAPRFAEVAVRVAGLLRGRTLVGYGCHRFDVPMLDRAFEMVGIEFEWGPVIDVGEIYKQMRPRRLGDALREFCNKEHVAHRALDDAIAVKDVLEAMLGMEHLAGKSAEEIAQLSNHGKRMADPAGKLAWIDGVLCFNTHRNRGVPVVDDLGYAQWMMRTMPTSTCRMIQKEIETTKAQVKQPSLF